DGGGGREPEPVRAAGAAGDREQCRRLRALQLRDLPGAGGGRERAAGGAGAAPAAEPDAALRARWERVGRGPRSAAAEPAAAAHADRGQGASEDVVYADPDPSADPSQ